MQGVHLTADLDGCAAKRPEMSDPAALRAACLGAVEAAGLTPVGELFHRFRAAATEPPSLLPSAALSPAPPGITGVVLLAESHLAVHTWPELDAATLDVYVCNLGRDNTRRAEALLDALVALFEPAAVERHSLARGRPGARRATSAGAANAASAGAASGNARR